MMASISLRRFYLFLMIVTYVAFLYLKENFGEPTPDEIFYTSNTINPDDLTLKFLITQVALSTLYNINNYSYPLINLLIALWIFNFLYKKEVLRGQMRRGTLLLMFFLPSVIYFSCAYLRDIYIFYLVTTFVFASIVQEQRIKWLLLLLGLTVLRYEAGLIVFLAYLVNYIISKRRKTYFKLSIFNLGGVFAIMMILLFFMLENKLIWSALEELIIRYEKKSTGYGIFQAPINQESIFVGSVINWFAFYAPFLFKPITSAFSVLMFIDSVVVGFLFFRAFFCFKSHFFYKNPLYRISLMILFATFFVAIPESVPETMYRHRMAYLPFLLFLNFPRNEKAFDRPQRN